MRSGCSAAPHVGRRPVHSSFMRAVRERSDAALASGDLLPVETGQVVVEERGLAFIVRWAAALARKDAAAPPAAEQSSADGEAVVLPGGPRDPSFNPFLNPDPALTIGPIGDRHTVILNKFPVCLHHLVLARREFAEQLSPLEETDFRAMAQLLSSEGGLGFYNGGAAAGASQRHKHVQWIPASPENASLLRLAAELPPDTPEGTLARHPALTFTHRFLRVQAGRGVDIEASAQSLLRAFEQACAALDLRPGADGLLPPFNLLAGDGWMLVVPRSREHFEGISLNALSFGGTLYVRAAEQVETIRSAGPLQVLASVATPAT